MLPKRIPSYFGVFLKTATTDVTFYYDSLVLKQLSSKKIFNSKDIKISKTSLSYALSHFSHVRPFGTLWTIVHPAPLSMGFLRQEFWSGLPFPSPGDLPDPEIKSRSPALQADSLQSETPGKPLRVLSQVK